MVVVYKNYELYDAGKLVGEIFTQYPVNDIYRCGCFVGTLKHDSVEIDNDSVRFGDTNHGMVFTKDLVDKLDDVFGFWNKRKNKMAGWIQRASFHTSGLGYEYSKPGSDKWVFIEEKRLNKNDIKKVSKEEKIQGFNKIEEEYVNDEISGESYRLSDGTVLVFERNEVGFKKDDCGLIIAEHDLPVFKELVDLWKVRRKNYSVLIKKGGNYGKQKQI
jgi:hypothetical protein